MASNPSAPAQAGYVTGSLSRRPLPNHPCLPSTGLAPWRRARGSPPLGTRATPPSLLAASGGRRARCPAGADGGCGWGGGGAHRPASSPTRPLHQRRCRRRRAAVHGRGVGAPHAGVAWAGSRWRAAGGAGRPLPRSAAGRAWRDGRRGCTGPPGWCGAPPPSTLPKRRAGTRQRHKQPMYTRRRARATSKTREPTP